MPSPSEQGHPTTDAQNGSSVEQVHVNAGTDKLYCNVVIPRRNLGYYHASYREDGSVVCWIPSYYRKPARSEQIIPIIKSGLESAPLEERKIIADQKMQWINHISSCGYIDDVDLRFVSFDLRVSSRGSCVCRQAGDASGLVGIEAARAQTVSNLLKFCDGVTCE